MSLDDDDEYPSARAARRATTRRRAGRGVMVIPFLTGCAALLSDPPPDPETAPLEVVVGSRSVPEDPCLLNRDELAAGVHDVLLIAETGAAVVRIRSRAGALVFEGAAQPEGQQAEPPQEIDQRELRDDDSVELQQGTYTVECQPAGGPVTTRALSVAAARPGS